MKKLYKKDKYSIRQINDILFEIQRINRKSKQKDKKVSSKIY